MNWSQATIQREWDDMVNESRHDGFTTEISADWETIPKIYESVMQRVRSEFPLAHDLTMLGGHSSLSYINGTNMYFVYNYRINCDPKDEMILYHHPIQTIIVDKKVAEIKSFHDSLRIILAYKNINHIDSDLKEITLTQNANTNDAANIFRYATDKFSNNSWYQVRRNLTASAQEIRLDKEQKGYSSNSNEMKLKVDFPIKQTISLNAKVKILDD